MSTYTAPLKDMRFVLNELAGLSEVAKLPGYEEATRDTVDAILDEAARFASGVLDPLNRSGDQEGSKWADGNVRTPKGFADAYRKFAEGGWNALPFEPDWGGQGLPKLVATPVDEMWTSANMSFSLCPLLTQAVGLVAHRVIRNRGTVCGSIAHADPASELPAVLLALDGNVTARSIRGERVIPAGELFAGVFETSLAPDEILVEAWFPASPKPSIVLEESRRHGDFALAGVVRAGNRVALFGVAPTPVLADPRDPARGLEPSGDLEATRDFRLHLVRVLTERAMAA